MGRWVHGNFPHDDAATSIGALGGFNGFKSFRLRL